MSLSEAQVRATVAVSDLPRAVEFYEGKLGLSPFGDDAMGPVRIYRCGRGSLLQVYESEYAGTAAATVASWSAADFDAVLTALAERGVEFEASDDPETDAHGVHSFGQHRVAWLKDPDGNTLAIDNGLGPS